MFPRKITDEWLERRFNRIGNTFLELRIEDDGSEGPDSKMRSHSHSGRTAHVRRQQNDDAGHSHQPHQRTASPSQQPSPRAATTAVDAETGVPINSFPDEAQENGFEIPGPGRHASGADAAQEKAAASVVDERDGYHITTLMIRNLPRYITQVDLAKEVNENGYAGKYDFLYMPCCFRTGKGCGYAFINFTDTEVASDFEKAWHLSQRFRMNGNTTLNISYKCIQGQDANMAKWCTSKTQRIRNPAFRPHVVSSAGGPLQPWAPAGMEEEEEDTGMQGPRSLPGMQRVTASSQAKLAPTRPARGKSLQSRGRSPQIIRPSVVDSHQPLPWWYYGQAALHPEADPAWRGSSTSAASQTHAGLFGNPPCGTVPWSSGYGQVADADYYEQRDNYGPYGMASLSNDGGYMVGMMDRSSSFGAQAGMYSIVHRHEHFRMASTARPGSFFCPR